MRTATATLGAVPSNDRPASCCLCAQLADKEEEISLLASECVGKDERLEALERALKAVQSAVSHLG